LSAFSFDASFKHASASSTSAPLAARTDSPDLAATAALLGPMSLWAVLLAGLAVGLLVLCYAQAASYFDEPGGSYLYAREAFGRFAGFEIGWMIWLTRISSAASGEISPTGRVLALSACQPFNTRPQSMDRMDPSRRICFSEGMPWTTASSTEVHSEAG
jgi:hypothetical protein